jgi:hypothetical protein
MTGEQLDFIVNLKTRFWFDFSRLCDRYIQEAADRFPELTGARYQDYISTVMDQLGESTSIYGRAKEP